MAPHRKSYFLLFLKLAVPLAIILWLLSRLDPTQLADLRDRPKDWGRLVASLLVALVAVCVTFVRWYLLVRALDIPFQMRDAFRLGFLGYLLNFVSIGLVGGDLFKAIFIAREKPGRRAEAVASVVVDRVIGLYALLLVTTTAILLAGVPQPTPQVQTICRLTLLATVIGGLGILLLLVPGFTSGSLSEFITGLPRIGPMAGRLITAVRMYRRQPGLLAGIVALSMFSHGLFTVSVFLIAQGLFHQVPPLADHLIIIPLAMVAGAIPFTPAGFGALELAMDHLYAIVAPGQTDASGVLIALAYRLVTIVIAMIGVVYYWTSRREVQAVLATADELGPELAADAALAPLAKSN